MARVMRYLAAAAFATIFSLALTRPVDLGGGRQGPENGGAPAPAAVRAAAGGWGPGSGASAPEEVVSLAADLPRRRGKSLFQQSEDVEYTYAGPRERQLPRQAISGTDLGGSRPRVAPSLLEQQRTAPDFASVRPLSPDARAAAEPTLLAPDGFTEIEVPSVKDIHHRLVYKHHKHTEEDEKEDHEIYHLAKRNLIKNKLLILAVASYGNLDFTQNWIASLHQTGHEKYLVMCLDELICAELDPAHSAVVPQHWLLSQIASDPLTYGTTAYVNLVQSKTLVVIPFLKMGMTILFSDVDIMWRSPGIVPYFEFMMADNAFREAVFSIEQTRDPLPSVNTGFWLAKPTPTIIQLFDRTVDLQARRKVTQQYAFNSAMQAAELRTSPKIGYLDKALFPNGWVFFRDKLHEVTGIQPLIVHANYLRGSESKRQRMREAGMWLLDEKEKAGGAAQADMNQEKP